MSRAKRPLHSREAMTDLAAANAFALELVLQRVARGRSARVHEQNVRRQVSDDDIRRRRNMRRRHGRVRMQAGA